MDESDPTHDKKTRITYLAAGAIIGGISGYLIGNTFLGSSVGMVAGVILGGKAIENT
jgi:hypothetical protein